MQSRDLKTTEPQKRKPASSPDSLTKTGTAAKVELTEDELRKVSGGTITHADKTGL